MVKTNQQQQHFDIADNDRISKLPDSILCHILSFLPTEDSITTCCLSKRWRFTWTSVAVLDLTDQSFRSLHIPKRRRTSASIKSFKNFVNMVLILRSHPVVQRFRLQLYNAYEKSDVHLWIFAAITHSVQELDLSTKQRVSLPRIVFSCGTIVELKLDSNIELNVPESISLPSLKVLHLTGIPTLCDATIGRLLSGSPVLEKLLINRDLFDGCKTISIVSSSLKDFVLMNYAKYGLNHGVLVDAPKLEFFELIDLRQHAEIEFKNASSIERVTIDFNCHKEDYVDSEDKDVDSEDENIDRKSFSLSEIRNVKILSLPLFLLHKAPLISPGIWFPNLTKLSVRYREHEIETLPRILTRLPSLQVLILKKAWCCYPKATCDAWKKDNLEIMCLKYSFKRLEIEEFEGREEEMEIVEYFVENARVLNEIRLLTRRGRWTEPEKVFMRKLLMLPRCSNAFKFQRCSNAFKIIII